MSIHKRFPTPSRRSVPPGLCCIGVIGLMVILLIAADLVGYSGITVVTTLGFSIGANPPTIALLLLLLGILGLCGILAFTRRGRR